MTAPQWTAALWSRLEALGGELADCCIKVYTLEKVLQQKKDTVTQTNFMDEAMKVMFRYPSFDTIPLIEEIILYLQILESKPSTAFWSVLARTLERQCKEAARSSSKSLGSSVVLNCILCSYSIDFYAADSQHWLSSFTKIVP